MLLKPVQGNTYSNNSQVIYWISKEDVATLAFILKYDHEYFMIKLIKTFLK